MTTTQATRPMTRAERTALVHQLAAAGHSHRAVARQTGMHHTTVGRILRTTPAPAERAPEQAERTTPAPSPAPERTITLTSGVVRAPRLLYPLDPTLIQDLNVLTDPRTGALPDPIRRYLRAAANARRTTMRTTAHHLAAIATEGPTHGATDHPAA
ncbi:hypothetical protein [Streptomyces sp. SID5910]|uniref:hypothetical protein n=1 Tax=Streptomyces sp. SID5910 TaxID=2690312 RepID=UPI00136B50EC|nr:hypothetical protein [Streptomyces sp. SID5910]MYR46611.1 hypothetical protein [Streptomyces sp. SID5910]